MVGKAYPMPPFKEFSMGEAPVMRKKCSSCANFRRFSWSRIKKILQDLGAGLYVIELWAGVYRQSKNGKCGFHNRTVEKNDWCRNWEQGDTANLPPTWPKDAKELGTTREKLQCNL